MDTPGAGSSLTFIAAATVAADNAGANVSIDSAPPPSSSVQQQPSTVPLPRESLQPANASSEVGWAELALPLCGSLHSMGGSLHRQRSLAASHGGFSHADVTDVEDVADEHAAVLKAVPTDRCCHTWRIRWWGWQPQSVMFWGVLVQLLGAVLFNVSCAASLPGTLPAAQTAREAYLSSARWEWLPSIVGSAGFVLASYVYLAEVTHSYHPCALPAEPSVGYAVCVLNLGGSLLFFLASLCYFARPVPPSQHAYASPPAGGLGGGGDGATDWQWEVSEWGVRFTFGVGSACFLLGAVGAIAEVLNDADPLAILRRRRAACAAVSRASQQEP